MSARDLLERWRISGTPGAPSAAGVPADHVAERSAELESVLALLTDVQAEAKRIRAEAALDANQRRKAALEHGQALIAEARRTAAADRLAEAASAHAAGQESAARILDDARKEADAIARRARVRRPALVEDLLRQAREEILEMTQVTP